MNLYALAPAAARRVLAGVALACAAALLSGCASTSTGAGGAPTGGGTGTTASGGSSASSSGAAGQGAVGGGIVVTASPKATSGGSGGPGPCATRSLSAKLGISQGTAGSVYTTIVFTNISKVTCTLYGFPGVALDRGNPVTQVGLAAARNTGSTKAVITLAPGKQANALLKVADAANYPSATCGPVNTTYLQVIPPNQTTPIYVAYSTQTCSKSVQTLTVEAVAAGNGG